MGSSELEKLSAILVSLQSKIQCPICLKNIEQTAELNCQHRFCEDCILQLKKEKQLVCPICKAQMKKRVPIFKDCFADEFGKFVNNVSRIISEEYCHSVNELNSGNLNLIKIANTACENIVSIPKDDFPSPSRTRFSKKNEANLPNMELSDITRNKVISWLKKVPSKSDALTPSPPCEEDFQMPSISQVVPVGVKKHKDSRQRSQSLTIHNNLPISLLKRYQSLAEGLNDDYNIEEIQSETLVKQVERKVIQDILEDECLANFEQAAESLNKGTKITPSKMKSDKIASSENMSNACSYSGWERIENNNTNNTAPRQIKKKRKISPKKGESSGGLQHPTKAERFQVPKETYQNEDIPTYLHIVNKNENVICHIPPISTEFDDLSSVAIQLHNNLKSCLSDTQEHQEEQDLTFSMNNFTNLLSYVEKLVQLLPKEANTSNSKPTVNQMTTATQTLLPTVRSIANQANFQEDRKSVLNKCVQALIMDSRSVGTQADGLLNVSDLVGWEEHVCRSETKLENGGEFREGEMKDLNDQNLIRSVHDKPSQARISSNTSSTLNGLLISSGKPKRNKSRGPSRITSQESDMIVTLSFPNKSEHKISSNSIYPHTDQAKKFKRIRTPSSDSEVDEEGQPNKRRLIRDDLTVEFADTENIEANSGNKDPPVTFNSEKMDYDQYLLDAMLKYDPGPITNSVITENKIPPKMHIDEGRQIKSVEAQVEIQKRTSQPIGKTQRSSSTVASKSFTPCDALDNHFDKFDKEIMEYQEASPFNTELEMVENTPYPEVTRFPTKRRTVIPIPLNGRSQILSKGSANSDNSKKKHEMLPHQDISNVSNKSLCTLNHNINVQSYFKIVTGDVEDILKDLHNNDDFFGGTTESMSVAGEVEKLGSHKTQSSFSRNVENVMENIKDFENDEDIENQLKTISFPNEQLKQDQLNVAQTTTSNKINKSKNIVEEIIEGSDVSDDEIIDTTPQKNKASSSQRFILRSLNERDNFEAINEDLDFCLPPPPEFDDDNIRNFPGEDLETHLENTKENCPIPALCDPSLTPDKLSDLIVRSEDMPIRTEKVSTQESYTFNASVFSPHRKCNTSTPKRSRKTSDESQSKYASIAKRSIRQSQTKYSPLVSTPKPAKKSSLMTSTPNQKSILNFVVSQQSVSPSQKKRPCIMWSRILDRDLNVFTQLECRKLLTTSKVFTPQVTHVVVLVDESGRIVSHTAKILQAIAAGIWVVRYEWAENCLLMKRIVSEEPYEALDTTGEPGPRMSRLIGKSQPLFVGYRFYLAPPLRGVSRQDLEYAIRLAGGEIIADITAFLKNRGKVDVIVTEISATEDTDRFEGWLENFKTVTVDVEWLSSCIGQYKIVSCRPFLAAGDESVICNLGYPDTLMESVPFTLTEAD
ncbi:breast cancer type 1 susceptibility protein homolog isoform X2 [Euwallacea similis]|uniref:breast cancer type 1 susceptibility protein homolog isoform X2 n=1 Tax=Euwallacea similis TaxID=1736056 RepID=UPI00344DB25D